MNYYYDVLLNFLDTNVFFYEWDSFDNFEQRGDKFKELVK